MQAENNWKDQLGKRLYDYEEEPLPDTWSKIEKDLKPSRFRWWLWLPLVPLLISLLWLENSSGLANEEKAGEQTITGNTTPAEKIQVAAKPKRSDISAQAEPGISKTGNIVQPEISSEQANNKLSAEKPKTGNAALVNGIAESNGPAFISPTSKVKPGSFRDKPVKAKAVIIAAVRPRPIKKQYSPIAESKIIEATNTSVSGKLAATNGSKNAGTFEDKKQNRKNKEKEKATSLNIGKDKISSPASGGNTASGPTGTLNQTSANNLPGNKPVLNTPVAGVSIYSQAVQTESEISEIPKENLALNQTTETLPVTLDSVSKTRPTSPDSSNKPNNSAARKWSVLVYGSPQYAIQRVMANRNDQIMVLKMNNLNEYSSERLGYEFGFRGQYGLTEKVELEAGFQFAHLTQYLTFTTATGPADSTVVAQNNNQLGIQVYNRQEQQQYLFRYYLAGAFAGANYTVLPRLALSGGAGLNYVLRTESGQESISAPVSKLNPYLTIGLKYSWKLNENLTLQAGPTMQYYLKPLQKDEAPLCAKPTTFGFTVGIQFQRKKE
jgi:hypothetical protein